MIQERPFGATTLIWGVKQSFRSYVEGAGGAIETRGGAGRTADGEFIFAAAPEVGLQLDADEKLHGAGKFLGEMRFDAHGGMLSVHLVDPSLEMSSDRAAITVAESGDPARRIEIAWLNLAALFYGKAGEIIIPAAVARDGGRLLGDHYQTMTPLDPVRLILAAT